MAKKVLVVEGDLGSRGALTALLKDEGYEVVAAVDGHRALELLPSERPDLVIVDVMVAGTDGQHTVREIEEQPGMAQTPVIVLRATEPDGAGTEEGRTVFMSKPVDVGRFLGIVHGILA